MSSRTQTLYHVLGVSPTATSEDIRKAYKQKALETHPDKLDPGASDEDKRAAEARFHEVCKALETLGDALSRRAYDVRMNIRVDQQGHTTWRDLSEDQIRRMRDREEWARQAEEKHQERMRALKEVSRREREEMREQAQEVREYTNMVEQMLKHLCDQTPEWEERKKIAHRRKAENDRLKGYRRHKVL